MHTCCTSNSHTVHGQSCLCVSLSAQAAVMAPYAPSGYFEGISGVAGVICGLGGMKKAQLVSRLVRYHPAVGPATVQHVHVFFLIRQWSIILKISPVNKGSSARMVFSSIFLRYLLRSLRFFCCVYHSMQ